MKNQKFETLSSDFERREQERIKRSNELWAKRSDIPCVESTRKKKSKRGRGSPILEGRQF